MKKNNYIFLLIMISFVLLADTAGIGHASASATGLQMTFTTNPVATAAGTNGYLEVNLKGIGAAITNIDISASSWDPNVIIPQGNWNMELTGLDSGESYSVLYEFKVSSTATPGLYQVIFDVDYSGGSETRQTAIIKVQDPIVLDLTAVTPMSIAIGEATTLMFNITNNGGATINNILFNWEDPNDLILPIGSDNRIRISSIAGGNYTEIPVVVMASSGLSPGVYPLTITLDFYDQGGTEQTITSTVGLQISGTTTFDVVVQTSTGTSTTFAIVNTGANTASSVVVSIPQQPSYTTSGTSSSSVGNLDAGDYTLASFQISSTSSNSTMSFPSFNRTGMGGTPPGGNFSGDRSTFMNRSSSGFGNSQLLVQISYTDVFGVRQTIQKQVSLSGSASGFSSRTSTQGSSGSFPNGFSGQSRSSSSGSNNSIAYIAIGVIGIIIIFALIQIGRKKKLPDFKKLFKGRNKE